MACTSAYGTCNTDMWADALWAVAQRDGRPAEYRWRPLQSPVIPFLVAWRKFWLTPPAGVPCNNAANTGERKT